MTAAVRVAALALLLALPGARAAAPADGPQAPRDPDFGVVADGAIGLERRVEMFQWQRDGDGYRQAWSDRPIDSGDFAAGHDNPPGIPLRSRQWGPGKVRLDGKPVAPAAVEALGRWHALRPDFSALPGNLSATFQPEGDGLGSAANPVRPKIGDLRITWRALRMPETYDGLVLLDGRWELDASALAASRRNRANAPAPPANAGFGWILLGALAAALVGGAWMLRRRRRGS